MNTDEGIISLVSSFSVYCVTHGGRVSLAHLVEFSHFVDLYVFENEIYFNSSEKEVYLDQFNEDKNSPILLLPDNELSFDISDITDKTRGIYDAAPVERTFSLGSYDYWIKLSDEEKKQIVYSPNEKYDWFGRSGLLINSKDLDNSINSALEKLGQTKYTLMPSSRNLLPFLHSFHQIETPAKLMYRQLTSAHRQAVEKVLALTRPRTLYLPPLLGVLLSRSRSYEDIPYRLIELRAEYSDFRKSIGTWFNELDRAKTIKEKIRIREELENSITVLANLFENKRRGFYKEMAGAFVSGLEEADVTKMITKPAFTLLKEGITNIVPELLSVRRYTGLIDLMDEALKIKDYENLLTNVFGNKLDISQQEITNIKSYRKYITSTYNVDLLSPS